MRLLTLIIFILSFEGFCQINLVRDINTYGEGSNSSRFYELSNGKILFEANSPEIGEELWITDGTEDGTQLIKDFTTDPLGSSLFNFQEVLIDDLLYFRSRNTNGDFTRYLHVTDGTTAGTVPITNGFVQYNPSTFQIAKFQSELYFADSRDLRKVDGTNSTLIFEFSDSPSSTGIFNLIEGQNRLYIVANDGLGGIGLWTSDGTEEGTSLLAGLPNFQGLTFSNSIEIDDVLYFSYQGNELWRSDGTSEGTYIFKTIPAGTNNSSFRLMTNLNGQLLFHADDGEHGEEPWISDGSDEGTYLLKDVNPGSESSDPTVFFVQDGIAYFNPVSEVGSELWKTDGTTSGTEIVKDIYPGEESSGIIRIAGDGQNIMFGADDGEHGRELWISDGSEEGTTLLRDVNEGPDGSYVNWITNLSTGEFIFWAATNSGIEPWLSDGTADGTRIIKDIHPGTSGFNPSDYLKSNDEVLMIGCGGRNTLDIWSTRGSIYNTRTIAKIDVGSNDPFKAASPSMLAKVNNSFFVSGFRNNENILWAINGEDGSVLELEGTFESSGQAMIFHGDLNDQLLFSTIGLNLDDLWTSDGTQSGTKPLGLEITGIRRGVIFNDKEYLEMSDETYGSELWCTDGTLEGTKRITDFTDPDALLIDFFTFNELIFFTKRTAIDPEIFATQDQVWVTDGTTEGTSMLLDLAIDKSHVIGEMLYLIGDNLQVWSSDGTPEGTTLVGNVIDGGDGGFIYNFTSTVLNNKILIFERFPFDESFLRLHIFDTSTGQGNLVRNFNSSEFDLSFGDDLTVGTENYFILNYIEPESFTGTGEIWVTDGTVEGTTLKEELPAFTFGANFLVDNKMIFPLDLPDYGKEIWSYELFPKEEATITLSDLEQVFDGEVKSPTVTTAPEGLNTVVLYDDFFTAPIEIGEYEIEVFIDDPVYEGMTSGKLIITELIDEEPVIEVTGIRDDPEVQIKLFPNPTATDATFSFQSTRQLSQVQLIDLLGKEVLRKDIQSDELILPLSSLQPAIYLLLVYDDSENIIKRIRVAIQK